MFHHDRQPVRFLTVASVWALCVIAAAAANACSVPVYRYALEHWQPDPYIAVVFHRGAMTDEQQSLVDRLQPKGQDGRPIVNLIVKTVDLDEEQSDVVLQLWEQHETDQLPLLSLQTPPKHGPPETAWFGALNDKNVARLADSPARQAIQKKLLGGDSVVWVFLDSGKQQEDDASFQLLNKELARLQDVIELPAIEEQDLGELSVDPAALKLAFSSIRVSRDDEQEQPLIEMLLRVEGDLRDEPYASQPMAFPVFARGRALYALVGDGITPETIEDASRFLAGACQCTVKAQNPGVDLMMAVDWEQLVTPALPYDDAPPTLAGLTTFAPQQPETGEDADQSTPDDSQETPVTDQSESVAVADGRTASNLDATSVVAGSSSSTGGADESLARNITLFLGLICACVVAVTLIVVTRR